VTRKNPRKPSEENPEDALILATLGPGSRRYQSAPPPPRQAIWAPPAPAAPPVAKRAAPVAAPAPAPAAAPRPEPRSRRRLLGEILVDEGRVTAEQLDAALRVQADHPPGTPLGRILVEQGLLTQAELMAVLDRHRKKYRLGDLLVETNACSEEQLEIALREQNATGLRLGDVLIRLGFVTELELRQALSKQLRVPFVDLDAMLADVKLAGAIDAATARRSRGVPLARTGGRITVAVDDPTDDAAIEALEGAAGCALDLVTGTAAAIGRAFARVYGEPLEPDAAPAAERAAAPAAEPAAAPAAEPAAALAALRQDLAVTRRLLDALGRRHAGLAAEVAELRAACDPARGAGRAPRGQPLRSSVGFGSEVGRQWLRGR
jgi:hypothetical protein